MSRMFGLHSSALGQLSSVCQVIRAVNIQSNKQRFQLKARAICAGSRVVNQMLMVELSCDFHFNGMSSLLTFPRLCFVCNILWSCRAWILCWCNVVLRSTSTHGFSPSTLWVHCLMHRRLFLLCLSSLGPPVPSSAYTEVASHAGFCRQVRYHAVLCTPRSLHMCSHLC